MNTIVRGIMKRRSKGFTLIELIVAIAVAAILAIFFANKYGFATDSANTAGIKSTYTSTFDNMMKASVIEKKRLPNQTELAALLTEFNDSVAPTFVSDTTLGTGAATLGTAGFNARITNGKKKFDVGIVKLNGTDPIGIIIMAESGSNPSEVTELYYYDATTDSLKQTFGTMDENFAITADMQTGCWDAEAVIKTDSIDDNITVFQ